MAFKMRKDIKNSSYYVWFLGAQEARGLRGPEYVLPVIKSLVEREKDVEPFKITLQVSSKGIKIIQNVPTPIGELPVPRAYPKTQKTEVIKHFIPHHTLTYVLQDNDIVAYILLLFNPVTKCPVHVHAHRCDSTETAFTLTSLLQTLIERPENQKKLTSIEISLKAKGLLPPVGVKAKRPQVTSPPPRKPDSEVERERGNLMPRTPSTDRIANLYDSLAAELREKLGSPPAGHAPILLPPRDYDTVHRQKGNLVNIETRECRSANVVGVNVKNSRKSAEATRIANGMAPARTKIGSSGGSSGIGSDHAPSPEQDSETRERGKSNSTIIISDMLYEIWRI
ncbi:unnamed protein product [Bemisia tabaci]|uniref:Uncharacterized protein n=1 Tax=Bemisia tabaci TaxID=7038 RepID=A0A9P0AC09_BEMTA|nr:unnamed protein product [Bemisia tabaci]